MFFVRLNKTYCWHIQGEKNRKYNQASCALTMKATACNVSKLFFFLKWVWQFWFLMQPNNKTRAALLVLREQEREPRTVRKWHTMVEEEWRREWGEVGETEEGNLERENVRNDRFGFTCTWGQQRPHRIIFWMFCMFCSVMLGIFKTEFLSVKLKKVFLCWLLQLQWAGRWCQAVVYCSVKEREREKKTNTQYR